MIDSYNMYCGNVVCKIRQHDKGSDMPILLKTIRIHHELEGGIEKSVPRIFFWHH